ncbi:MAG TPA: phenylacetate-CoA oxygenase subunit PaaJ [Taishania sp.]|nr:phenylacetate-CoA oxygenase subunit PaaJ [Taishania sp.]
MYSEEEIWDFMEEVFDPEVPVLTLVDLGVVRKVNVDGEKVKITITPTYSGCPAMRVMEQDIIALLHSKGIENCEVETVLAPAWTTDWISENGRIKLKEYGIAPPADELDKSVLFGKQPTVECPRCNSTNTHMISQFGSTSCKAQFRCKDCLEPFEYFKCLK